MRKVPKIFKNLQRLHEIENISAAIPNIKVYKFNLI